MDRWILDALLAMLFAGLTSVIAKAGLSGISGELGVAVRTVFVFGFVLVFAALFVPRTELGTLSNHNLIWLGLSGLTTALSWIFYYRALHAGEVSTVAIMDKGSFLVAVLLAWLVLGEKVTLRTGIGCAFILTGLLIVVKR